ncbi:hypothetical protein [Saccharopolyspora sp. NPDC050642]|uniref:hypothetical protein n=1 Tax=Saccharopolyspora sp. NPDC050642 TaxID=3157099 RepID=UPI003408EAEC
MSSASVPEPARPAPLDESSIDRGVALARRRLLPVLVLMYVISYLDRLNLSYAEPSISRTLELSATVFGAAAGAFFLGYALLEVPSNLPPRRSVPAHARAEPVVRPEPSPMPRKIRPRKAVP